MYGRSIVGQAGDRLRVRPAPSDLLGVASAFRTFNTLALDAVDPFGKVDLRAKFDRLFLLPLQVSNYYSFNEQTNYRTQFEYLLDVLSACPRDVGVIAVEYVQWGHILKSSGSGENVAYLKRNFPQLIFLQEVSARTVRPRSLSRREWTAFGACRRTSPIKHCFITALLVRRRQVILVVSRTQRPCTASSDRWARRRRTAMMR